MADMSQKSVPSRWIVAPGLVIAGLLAAAFLDEWFTVGVVADQAVIDSHLVAGNDPLPAPFEAYQAAVDGLWLELQEQLAASRSQQYVTTDPRQRALHPARPT